MTTNLVRAWGYLKELIGRFGQDHLSAWAAAASFFILICLLPLLMLAVAGAAQLLGSSQRALAQVMEAVSRVSPSSTDLVRRMLERLVEERGVLGAAGALSLLWTGSQVFLTLESALNAVWELKGRPFWQSRLTALGVTVLLGSLFLLSIGLSFALSLLRGLDLLGIGRQQWLWQGIGLILPIFITFLTFLLLYRILPNAHIPWRVAALGAGFAAVTWELAKLGFSAYLGHLASRSFQSLYGSLAGVVILIVWIYYSCWVTLIGAEIAALTQKRLGGRRA